VGSGGNDGGGDSVGSGADADDCDHGEGGSIHGKKKKPFKIGTIKCFLFFFCLG